MPIEVPLPDIAALPVWAYVTGGVWAWYVAASGVIRVMRWAGVFRRYSERASGYDLLPTTLGVENLGLADGQKCLARRVAIAAWIASPVFFPGLIVLTVLWSSAHVASLGLVPRPWSRSAVA